MTVPKVVLGLQGAQMPANAIRGIGRWTAEFVFGLLEHHPGLLAAVSLDEQLPLPRLVSALPSEVSILRSSEPPAGLDAGGYVFHSLSPLEDLSIDRIWPRWARDPRVGLVTTMYDMIPLLFPGDYFQGGLKRLLQVRYELHRQADAVIGISATTVNDSVELLGLDAARCFVAPGGINARFIPPSVGARQDFSLPGLKDGFILTIGNVDPRKNLSLLLTAYAALPDAVRSAHQLVVTCSQGDDAFRRKISDEATALGIGGDVFVLPYVDDHLMVRLYQFCAAMVYPSLYEGLGLPLIEAQACGAAVLASDVGPMREIVETDQARFNPHDRDAISGCLLEALTNPVLLTQLRALGPASAKRYSWETSMAAALGAYECGMRQPVEA